MNWEHRNCLLGMIVLLVAIHGVADDGSWINPAGGSWEESINWQDEIVASGIDATATFGTPTPAGDVAVAVNADLSLGRQVFGGADNDYAWLLSGEMLIFTNTSVPAVIEVNNRETVIANNMTTALGLEKRGLGTLTLTGKNVSEAILSVTAGTLALSNQASLTQMRISVADGAAMRIDGASDFWSLEGTGSSAVPVALNGTARIGRIYDRDGSTEYTFPDSMSGAGHLVKQGGNRQTLTGPQALTGAVEVTDGTLAIMAPTDIVAWFSFDDPSDIGRDSGPAGISLTKQGENTEWFDADGKFGGALKLNGQACLVHDKWEPVPMLLPLGNTAFTIAAWIKRDPDITLWGGIASWGPMQASFQSAGIRMNSASTVIQPSAGHTAVALDAPDEWQHVALTYDPTLASGKRKIYVNGVPKRSDSPAQDFAISTAFVSVGRGSTDLAHNNQLFKGLLDDVVLARVALTQPQIQSLMTAGAASFYTPPVVSNLLPPAASLTVGSSGKLLLNADQTIGGIDGEGGIVALANRATLTIDADSNTTLRNSIHGAGGLTKRGTDTTLTVAARQGYKGATRVEAGTLEVANYAPRAMDGIVAYYTFDNWDNPYEDISGNNIQMELKGSGTAKFYGSWGRIGGCMFLENTYLEPLNGFPSAMPTGNAPFSVSIWVNPAGGIGTQGGFVYWGYDSTRTRSGINLRLDGGYNKVAMASYSGHIVGTIGFDIRTGMPSGGLGVGWHHLCYTYNPTHSTAKQNLYVDGQLVASENQGDFHVESTHMRINCGRLTASNMGNSYIDDTIFFNRAITEEEVIYLSEGNRVVPSNATELLSPVSGVVGRYTFDDPDQLGKDTSGYGNDLQPVGSSALYTEGGKIGGGLSVSAADSWLSSGTRYPTGFPTMRMPYTLACWFNPDDTAKSGAGLFFMGTDASLRNLSGLAAGSASMAVETTGGNRLLASCGYNLFAADLPAGWHHFALINDPMAAELNRRLYVDGRLLAWDNSKTETLGTNFFYIGRGRSTDNNAFAGRIDEFVVMNRAATLSELHYLAVGMPEEGEGILPGRTELRVETGACAVFKGGAMNRIGGLAGSGELVLDGTSGLRIGGGETNAFTGILAGTSRIAVTDDTVQTLPLGTFAGVLAVSNATLLVVADQDIAAAGIDVAAYGRLGGEGTTAAPVTVASGGTLLSRTDASALTLGGAVNLAEGARLALTVSGETNTGNLHIGGALALPPSGSVELDLSDGRMGYYVIAEAAGGITGGENLEAWELVLTGAAPAGGKQRLKIDGNKIVASLCEAGTVLSIR